MSYWLTIGSFRSLDHYCYEQAPAATPARSGGRLHLGVPFVHFVFVAGTSMTVVMAYRNYGEGEFQALSSLQY